MTPKPGVFRQTNVVEIELMRHQEKVAEMRRQLRQGPEIQDYAFEEGPANLNAGNSPVRTA